MRGYAVTHPAGEVQLPTQPGWVQVIYAKTGLFVARTDRASWTVPPHRAMVVADGTRIRLLTRAPTAVRCLYVTTDLAPESESRVVDIGPLARELVLHAVESAPLGGDDPIEAALITLLAHHLSLLPTEELRLPLPGDPRARRLAETLLIDPSLPLHAAIAGVGAGRRTLERLFREETRMTLAGWQRRARVLAAVELMAATHSVTSAAAMVGYATPSSFVVAFRSELGVTPRVFINTRAA